MVRVVQFFFIALITALPAVASAGPAEDANATIDRWSIAYSGNDPEIIAKSYWPHAILLGTVSPVISEGKEAIVAYFTPTKGTGNKNAIDERRTKSKWLAMLKEIEPRIERVAFVAKADIPQPGENFLPACCSTRLAS